MPEELVEKEKASARRITQEKARQRKRKRENKKKKRQDKDVFDDIMDDHFSFIAGYTAGGAPFGTTWEEIGIDQSLSFEEKVKLYLEL
ncbi:MAG: hypothetical protein IJ679_11745 [Lachnospiraceae bacterium]|nr:hypothetical protein [Lachnospiraceae bacterium]